MADDSDRVIPATPRRREAARRQGAMPAAAPLTWAATAATAILLLPGWARATLAAATEMVRQVVAAAHADPGSVGALATAVVLPSVGLVLAAGSAGLAVRILCDGFSWQPGRLVPDPRRIDPLAGMARIFSSRTFLAALGDAAGLAVLGITAACAAGPLVAAVAAGDGLREPAAAWMAAWRPLAWLVGTAAVVAACQYAAARLRFERQIRMTPQEFADEAKSMQADPRVRLLQQGRPRQPASGTA